MAVGGRHGGMNDWRDPRKTPHWAASPQTIRKTPVSSSARSFLRPQGGHLSPVAWSWRPTCQVASPGESGGRPWLSSLR